MTFSVTPRAATAREEACVIVTPPKGSAERLTVAEARGLKMPIRNAVLVLDRHEREAALAKRIRSAKRSERVVRRPSKFDEQLREHDG